MVSAMWMPPFLRGSLLVFTAVALLALPLDAEAVTVPGDYPTIQAAINAVVSGALPNGKVIDLAPGSYNGAM